MLTARDTMLTARERHILANHWELSAIIAEMHETRNCNAPAVAMQRLLELEKLGLIKIFQEAGDTTVIRTPDVSVSMFEDWKRGITFVGPDYPPITYTVVTYATGGRNRNGRSITIVPTEQLSETDHFTDRVTMFEDEDLDACKQYSRAWGELNPQ